MNTALKITMFALALTGCKITPYIEAGVAAQVNRPDGYVCKNGTCQKPTRGLGKFEAGLEVEVKGYTVSGGYCHSSELARGWPSDNLGENYSDEICLSVKYKFKSF